MYRYIKLPLRYPGKTIFVRKWRHESEYGAKICQFFRPIFEDIMDWTHPL